MKLMNIKGSTDYLPNEQKVRNYIESTLREVFEQFGYLPIETPILCYYDLLSLKYDSDNEILNEIYKLSDQGNRSLGLRYDLTVPFAKFIALNKGIQLPFKKYEIGKAFRDGPVKVGRNREFIQCDVDVVGIEGALIEAELVSLFAIAFDRLKIEVEIKYNNRKLLMGLIEELNISLDKASDIIAVIDKMEKLSPVDIESELRNLELNQIQINSLLKCLSYSFDELYLIFENASSLILKEGLNEISELKNYIKCLGLDNYTKFVPSLARGQEYYTGTIFEVYVKDYSIKSSIASGGRYDNMIGDFIDDGNNYPAVGISFGLNVIYELLKDRIELITKTNIDVFIIPIGTEIESLKIANSLRKLNFKVEIDISGKKLKKALEYANKNKIPYIIIIGEDEIKSGNLKVKKMLNGLEKEIKINELEKLKDIIN